MAEQELSTLIRKRGTLKHKLTSFSQFVDKCIDSETSLESVIPVIQLRFEKIEGIFDEFQEVQNNLECQVKEEDLDSHFKYRDSFEEMYFTYTVKVREMINHGGIGAGISDVASSGTGVLPPVIQSGHLGPEGGQTTPVQEQAMQSQPPGSPSVQNTARDQPQVFQSAQLGVDMCQAESREVHSLYPTNSLRLPTIDLPKFNGDYHMWLEFKDTFEGLVHRNDNIPEVLKFHYLRSSLTGAALQHIQTVEFAATNYTMAWKGLLERYNNNRLLIHNHIKGLFELGNIKKDTHFLIRNLIDRCAKHLQALKALGEPIDHWDTLIIYILCNKFDEETAREWEHKRGDMKKVNLGDLYAFLRSRADELEALTMRDKATGRVAPPVTRRCNLAQSKPLRACFACKGKHLIYTCSEFLALPIAKRVERVRELGLCPNCLGMHKVESCTRGGCKICRARHNSLIHVDAVAKEVTSHATRGSNVLLATACVTVVTPSGKEIRARALLDSGSQSNFITEQFHCLLDVPEVPTKISITGISGSQSCVTRRCTIKIRSNNSVFSKRISCYILDDITDRLPTVSVDTFNWNIPDNIVLADPQFSESNKIDMLLGAGIFWDVLRTGKLQLDNTHVILQNTALGWIVSGTLPTTVDRVQCNFSRQTHDIQDQLEKFWTIEEVSKQNLLSSDERKCEELFDRSVTRHHDGRFIVKLPLKTSRDALGDSKQLALKRFISLERKLGNNEHLRTSYCAFMQEYERLGHMQRVDQANLPLYSYFLPHHAITKETGETTKLRVVFDGSARSTSGLSINDLQLVGPTIQEDLFSIFLRFRFWKYVIAADIKMMYRQIWVHPEDRHLQLILWRPTPADELQVFMLNTVTYGMASSPYLATRCLKQVALDSLESNPAASRTILSDFYMDDWLTGGETIEEVTSLATEVEELLKQVGFTLHKWVSNSPDILARFISANISRESFFQLGDQTSNKTLGLLWSPGVDVLRYSVKAFNSLTANTKRALLSDIAQVWDPMGLVAPCIVFAKIILQKLWLQKLDWDDEIPEGLRAEYERFRRQLPALNRLVIPRRVLGEQPVAVQLHGFADASQDAYGACLYVRTEGGDGAVSTHLLCARSRVAPLKTQTIPRLELCAALLLADLATRTVAVLNTEFHSVHLWSDSSIVLHWIHTVPSKLQVFVANRVARIQELSRNNQWHHVVTDGNPADLVSRGTSAELLINSRLWWHGPEWLAYPPNQWPISVPEFQPEPPEIRRAARSFIAVQTEPLNLWDKFSSLTTLRRVTAYVRRFIHNSRALPGDRITGPLTVGELSQALNRLVRLAQLDSFAKEIILLQTGKNDQLKVSLKRLNPFVDATGLLRVGGRLVNSKLPYNKKHPLLLSSKHQLTRIIFNYYHLLLLHAPPQLLLASLRELYWPIGGRSLARMTVHRCVRCFKTNPTVLFPQMGNLPNSRVQVNPPFSVTGTDFAGPFIIRDKMGRGSRRIKCYVCLFICFSTKAIHLEAVSDLSTEAFMMCFRRFFARRGKPAHIYSDNGSNYIGARNELREMYEALHTSSTLITDKLALEGISWHMIPPQAPHFGGLWEAGVKTIKYHLKRVMGNALLTYEQFSTILTQIEAVVNSRPLSPLSSDPNDFEALTPAHFLIGKKLISTPDPDYTPIKENRLSTYQRLVSLQQHFWNRWSKEYISQLQERQKWFHNETSLRPDELVLIKDPNVPVLNWKLGRVIALHPGSDGVSRVASIKTASGVVKRAFSKLCPFPCAET